MRLATIATYLSDFAWFWPGVAISVVASVGLARRVGSALGGGRLTGAALVFSVGLIVSATLTPSREALRFGAVGSGTCDLSRLGLAALHDVVTLGDPGFNILLFLPFGLVLATLPRSRFAPFLVAAIILPPAIEATQLLVGVLDRACQSSDVVDNLTGLVIGLAIGRAVVWLRGRRGPDDAGG